MNIYAYVLNELIKLPQCVPAHYSDPVAVVGEADRRADHAVLNTLTGMMVTAGMKVEGKVFGEKTLIPCSLLISCQPGQVQGGSVSTYATVAIKTEADAKKLLAAWRAQARAFGLPLPDEGNDNEAQASLNVALVPLESAA